MTFDVEYLKRWIGRTEKQRDVANCAPAGTL
jgi:hypothetical protein